MNVTFEDLRCQYQTGRAYVVSGEGRNRVYGYRNGVQCALGDIEEADWFQMVRDLIAKTGEQELYRQLGAYIKENHTWCRSKKEIERETLELYAARIFDNQMWVGFVQFNLQYRPEILNIVELVSVMPECCKQPGLMTRAMLNRYGSGLNENYCPHCGRWSPMSIISECVFK